MRKQPLLFIGVLIYILVVGGVVLTINRPDKNKKDNAVEVSEKAVAEAKALYRKAIQNGVDITSGPCLSNDLMTDWVADIVHSPREETDNLSHNQCPAYLEKRAHHFVELDTSGNLVRVR